MTPLEKAARELVERLRFIHEDEQYKSVWFVNQNHNGPYAGPNYVKELKALEAALEQGKVCPGCQGGKLVRISHNTYCPMCHGKGTV